MLIENFASLKISFQFISPKEEILYFYMPEAFFPPSILVLTMWEVKIEFIMRT